MKKKIIIITRSMLSGGAERVIAQLSNYFIAEKKVNCEIIMLDRSDIAYDLEPQVRVTEIGEQSPNKVIDKLKRYSLLRKRVKERKPDVILTMPEDIGIYAILALQGLNIPIYVSERNNPWVMPDVKITRFLRKIAYRYVDGIIFQTKMAKSFFPNYIQKKGIVLYNPVDASRIPVQYTGVREKKLVAVGRLEPQKNFSLLIYAYKKFQIDYPEYKLIIYGDGGEREKLAALISKLGLDDKVYMPGRNKNVLEKIRNASMFILSSDYEGMPNALIEAMCMGMPVISTDCPSGGPKELIKNKENGILVSVNNVEELYTAMLDCVDNQNSYKYAKNAYLLRKKLTDKKVFENWYDYLFEGLG